MRNRSSFEWLVLQGRRLEEDLAWQHKCQGRPRASAVAPGPPDLGLQLYRLRHPPTHTHIGQPLAHPEKAKGRPAQMEEVLPRIALKFPGSRPTLPLRCLTHELLQMILGGVGGTMRTSRTRYLIGGSPLSLGWGGKMSVALIRYSETCV